MKKVLLILTMLLFAAGGLTAQTIFQEEVRLKNGSIIKGVVMGYEGYGDNKEVRIRTSDGSLFVYRMDEIDSIEKIIKQVNVKSRNTSGRKRTFENGYRGMLETGFSFGIGKYGSDFYAATTSHGCQFNPYIYLGVGSGVHVYTEKGAGTPIAVPVFIHQRINFIDNDITPFLDMKAGYSFSDVEGFFFNPSVGASFGVGYKVGLNVSFGYTLQMIEVELGRYGSLSKISSGLMLKIGLEF